jgi:hypothetical protein
VKEPGIYSNSPHHRDIPNALCRPQHHTTNFDINAIFNTLSLVEMLSIWLLAPFLALAAAWRTRKLELLKGKFNDVPNFMDERFRLEDKVSSTQQGLIRVAPQRTSSLKPETPRYTSA